jgi:flagellar biosynthesis/type III secretory pathway ATPase
MPDITTADHRARARNFIEILATYKEAEDLINIGAYVKGSNPQIDHALSKIGSLRTFQKQDMMDMAIYSETVAHLFRIIEQSVD